MFRRAFAAALAATALTGSVLAQTAAPGQLCPKDAPCCGLYNDCGVGAFCAQGCDPVLSHSINACLPNPQCKSAKYTLGNLKGVQDISDFLGDASKADWVSQGTPVINDGALLLTLAQGTSGTVLSSTHYVWYGKICANILTSQGKGVVTAFIMMSDAKDEIDFEWIGADVVHAQSNYYSQGVTVYTHGSNLTVGNTAENMHKYCFDWTPDSIRWLIDDKELRKVDREGTWNTTANRYDFPQTPSRIMISLWPAGLEKNEKGTIDWAGGLIDWNSPYMTDAGYYAAMVKDVSVECYDPPPGAKGDGSKSYLYTDRAATNNTVELSNKEVILGSLYDTGEDPGAASASSVSSGATPTKTVKSVPGGNQGGGNRAEDAETTVATSVATETQTTGGNDSDGTGSTPFVQGDGNGQTQGSGSNPQPGLGKVGGGAVAIVIAVLGLIVL